jgi:hypothetical protein
MAVVMTTAVDVSARLRTESRCRTELVRRISNACNVRLFASMGRLFGWQPAGKRPALAERPRW